MRPLTASLFAPALLTIAACHAQTPVAHTEPTAATPVAAVCQPLGDSPKPFVIDWPADQRGDLEIALKHGTVVLSLTCNSARILRDCSADGEYSYVGTTEREDVTSLESADEVSANLPLLAPTLTRQSGGIDFAHGASLDLAVAVIGRRAATRTAVTRAELKGECRDATHFVREATLGAFAMSAGARGDSKLFADVSTRRAQMTKDGSLEACRSAKPDAESPVAQCAAPVRLELRALGEEAVMSPAAIARAKAAVDVPSCPAGMVLSESGACVKPRADRAHVCSWTDLAECTQQCGHGSQTSCAILGRSYQIGRGVPKNLPRATELFTKACEAGATIACGRLGQLALEADDVPKGMRLLTAACNAGWAEGCAIGGNYALKHPAIPGNELVTFWHRGCRAGDPEACWSLGAALADGIERIPQDEARALRYLAVACSGNARKGCTDYAKLLASGRGGPVDEARAFAVLTTACDQANTNACSDLAGDYLAGRPIPRDPKKTLDLLKRGCDLGDASTCLLGGQQLLLHAGVPADLPTATAMLTKACEAGLMNACAIIPKPAPPAH